MPNYTFENTKTGENFVEFMPISEKEKFLADNPHLKFVFTPIYIEQKASKMKPSSEFVERMGLIADSNPGTPLADKYGRKDQKKDKATRKVLKKHGVI